MLGPDRSIFVNGSIAQQPLIGPCPLVGGQTGLPLHKTGTFRILLLAIRCTICFPVGLVPCSLEKDIVKVP